MSSSPGGQGSEVDGEGVFPPALKRPRLELVQGQGQQSQGQQSQRQSQRRQLPEAVARQQERIQQELQAQLQIAQQQQQQQQKHSLVLPQQQQQQQQLAQQPPIQLPAPSRDDGPAPEKPKRRRSVSIGACEPCRKAHVRCDDSRPCLRCRTIRGGAGVARCVDRPQQAARAEGGGKRKRTTSSSSRGVSGSGDGLFNMGPGNVAAAPGLLGSSWVRGQVVPGDGALFAQDSGGMVAPSAANLALLQQHLVEQQRILSGRLALQQRTNAELEQQLLRNSPEAVSAAASAPSLRDQLAARRLPPAGGTTPLGGGGNSLLGGAPQLDGIPGMGRLTAAQRGKLLALDAQYSALVQSAQAQLTLIRQRLASDDRLARQMGEALGQHNNMLLQPAPAPMARLPMAGLGAPTHSQSLSSLSSSLKADDMMSKLQAAQQTNDMNLKRLARLGEEHGFKIPTGVSDLRASTDRGSPSLNATGSSGTLTEFPGSTAGAHAIAPSDKPAASASATPLENNPDGSSPEAFVSDPRRTLSVDVGGLRAHVNSFLGVPEDDTAPLISPRNASAAADFPEVDSSIWNWNTSDLDLGEAGLESALDLSGLDHEWSLVNS